MALISMRQMLDHAAEFGYGVPAFNVNNLEQMRAIMEAAAASPDPGSYRRIPAHPGVHAPGPRHQP
jgi:fructose/tagatose bisphosphate aldolase